MRSGESKHCCSVNIAVERWCIVANAMYLHEYLGITHTNIGNRKNENKSTRGQYPTWRVRGAEIWQSGLIKHSC